jgi:amidase
LKGFEERRLDGDTFFVPTHFYNVLGTRDPALRVSDGDAVVTSTLDAGGRDQANIERAPKPNPVMGPFFVEGVSPATRLLCRSSA